MGCFVTFLPTVALVAVCSIVIIILFVPDYFAHCDNISLLFFAFPQWWKARWKSACPSELRRAGLMLKDSLIFAV
jgi:hypothetical protein